MQKGSRQAVSFPELTVLAGNIDDVEIIPSSIGKKTTVSSKAGSVSNIEKATTIHSPHATPSVYASKAETFPAGNVRHTLPREEFDFVANLARFDKASEFKKIQSEDLVPKDERLVAINSPQRKLGIHENVLGEGERGNIVKIAKKPGSTSSKANNTGSSANIAGNASFTGGPSVISSSSPANSLRQSTLSTVSTASPVSVTDEIMEKFKHLALPSGKSASKVFVEDDSSSSESEIEAAKEAGNESRIEEQNFSIPMMDSTEFNSIFQEKAEMYRTTSALNFAHHLLAEIGSNSTSIVLLLGVDDAAAILMESFYHLCNHSRLQSVAIHAIFAAGGKGSAGKRIELSPATKIARKKLLSLEKVKFTTNLGDILKLQNVLVFDALGCEGELTQNAIKGLTEWMKKLLANQNSNKPIIYGIEATLLKNSAFNNLQLVTFGMARDTITPSLPSSQSILYVDAGIPSTNDSIEIFGQSFVTEIEY